MNCSSVSRNFQNYNGVNQNSLSGGVTRSHACPLAAWPLPPPCSPSLPGELLHHACKTNHQLDPGQATVTLDRLRLLVCGGVEVDRPVAYKEVLKTWAKWVDRNIDPNRTTVFFMGMSPNHITYVVVSHVFFSSALAIGLSVYLHFNFLRNASTLH